MKAKRGRIDFRLKVTQMSGENEYWDSRLTQLPGIGDYA